MKVDKILQTEQPQNPPAAVHHAPAAPLLYPGINQPTAHFSPSAPVGNAALYPTVADYMGLDLSPSEMQIIQRQQQQLQSMAFAQSQKVNI